MVKNFQLQLCDTGYSFCDYQPADVVIVKCSTAPAHTFLPCDMGHVMVKKSCIIGCACSDVCRKYSQYHEFQHGYCIPILIPVSMQHWSRVQVMVVLLHWCFMDLWSQMEYLCSVHWMPVAVCIPMAKLQWHLSAPWVKLAEHCPTQTPSCHLHVLPCGAALAMPCLIIFYRCSEIHNWFDLGLFPMNWMTQFLSLYHVNVVVKNVVIWLPFTCFIWLCMTEVERAWLVWFSPTTSW